MTGAEGGGAEPGDPELGAARGLVFVCTGNMVRSAFAHLYAEHLGLPRVLRSAATTYRNDRLFPETARALASRGVPADRLRSFRPTHLDDVPEGEYRGFLAFAMRTPHALRLARRTDLAGVRLLGSLTEGGDEIADPVLEGADFEATFRRVAACIEALAARLRG